MSAYPEGDDARLIAGLLRGEGAAVQVLDRWVDVVLTQEFRTLASYWEDLKQDVRLRIYRNLAADRFDARSTLRTYVHRVTRNVCIDHLRRAYRRHEREGPVPERGSDEMPDALSRLISRDLLARLLEALSPEERRLVRLVLCDHLSYEDTARTLGVAVGTVKSRMSRCKERIVRRYSELRKGEETAS